MKRLGVPLIFVMVLGLAGPARADLLDDAKNAYNSLNNLGDMGRAVAQAAVGGVRQGAERLWSNAQGNAPRLRAGAESTMTDARQRWQTYQQQVAQRVTQQASQAQNNLD